MTTRSRGNENLSVCVSLPLPKQRFFYHISKRFKSEQLSRKINILKFSILQTSVAVDASKGSAKNSKSSTVSAKDEPNIGQWLSASASYTKNDQI